MVLFLTLGSAVEQTHPFHIVIRHSEKQSQPVNGKKGLLLYGLKIPMQ